MRKSWKTLRRQRRTSKIKMPKKGYQKGRRKLYRPTAKLSKKKAACGGAFVFQSKFNHGKEKGLPGKGGYTTSRWLDCVGCGRGTGERGGVEAFPFWRR